MKTILEKYGVTLSAVNIIVPFSEAVNEEMFQGMLAEAHRLLDEAKAAGTKKVLFVPAGYFMGQGMTREQCFQTVVRALKDVCAYGKELGLIISTETLESCAVPYGSYGEMKRIFDTVPELKYTHDAGNPLVANEDPIAMYEAFRDRVVNVHFKDLGVKEDAERTYTAMDGTTLSLMDLDTGNIDFLEHLRRLKRDGFDGHITIEGTLPAENKWEAAKKSLKLFREMEENL